MGAQSNPEGVRAVLVEMFANYNSLDFKSIKIYKKLKCA